MRRILVCTGVLGGGTSLVFALAAITAVAFPQGTLVSAQWNGWAKPMAAGMELGPLVVGGPVPVPVERNVTIDVAPGFDVAPAVDPDQDTP